MAKKKNIVERAFDDISNGVKKVWYYDYHKKPKKNWWELNKKDKRA